MIFKLAWLITNYEISIMAPTFKFSILSHLYYLRISLLTTIIILWFFIPIDFKLPQIRMSMLKTKFEDIRYQYFLKKRFALEASLEMLPWISHSHLVN